MAAHRLLPILAVATLALALAPAEVLAAPAPVGRAALARALSDCRSIADPSARLVCYDKAAASLDEAQSSGAVVVIDRQQASQIKRQTFGFSFESLSIFDFGGKKDVADESINSVARSAAVTPTGRWVVTLEDGAVWRQIESADFDLDVRPGSKIRIRRAALGSFMMRVDRQSEVRVHRDQ
jgi:hypothetical protein